MAGFNVQASEAKSLKPDAFLRIRITLVRGKRFLSFPLPPNSIEMPSAAIVINASLAQQSPSGSDGIFY